MAKEDIKAYEYPKGVSGNPSGKPKGIKNRSTIAKYWLDASMTSTNPITYEEELITHEDMMTLALVKKARDGDVSAYKQLMDSAYGMPTQQIDVSNDGPIFNGIDFTIKD